MFTLFSHRHVRMILKSRNCAWFMLVITSHWAGITKIEVKISKGLALKLLYSFQQVNLNLIFTNCTISLGDTDTMF